VKKKLALGYGGGFGTQGGDISHLKRHEGPKKGVATSMARRRFS